jgi:PAP2 superfamily protein
MGVFFVSTWFRLVVCTGLFDTPTMVYAAFIAGHVAFVALRIHRGSRFPARHVDIFYYPLAVSFGYFSLKYSIPKIHQMEDAHLQAIDSIVNPRIVRATLHDIAHPLVTEVFSMFYLSLLPLIVFCSAWYYLKSPLFFEEFSVGLFSVYALGFIGYTFVPAVGPYLADPGFQSPPGSVLTMVNHNVVRLFSMRYDAFPSLHSAISGYIALFHWMHGFRYWSVLLAQSAIMWCAAVYLGYHYFIDLGAGLILACGASMLIVTYTKSDRNTGILA